MGSYQIPNIYNHETDDSKSNNEFEELENELLRKTRNRVNKNHDQFRKNKSRTEDQNQQGQIEQNNRMKNDNRGDHYSGGNAQRLVFPSSLAVVLPLLILFSLDCLLSTLSTPCRFTSHIVFKCNR